MTASGVPSESEGLGLGFLVAGLWARRALALATLLLFSAAGLAYALLAQKWYRADVVLMASDSSNTSSLMGPLDSLASIAGLSSLKSGDVEHSVAVLKSRDVIRTFIEQEDLLAVIFVNRWDAEARRWRGASSRHPDVRDAVRRFDRTIRKISDDKAAGTITLSISWTDPAIAAEWANKLVLLVNSKLREQAILESSSNIEYLRGLVANTGIAPLQQSVGKLLESEMQKLMLAKGTSQYAFRVVDPAQPPKYASRPQLVLVVIAFGLTGFFLCVFLVLMLDLVLPAARSFQRRRE